MPAELPRVGGAGFHLASLYSRLAAWWLEKNLRRNFWEFLSVSFLYDSGMFIFFLLYNLYLLDLGFREDFLGWTAAAVSFGSIAGSLPGGWFTHRLGLRRSMLLCLSAVPAIYASRAVSTSGPWLLALAFVGGFAGSLWAVALPPAVAQLTDDANRPFAFSVVFAAGIGFGVLAGIVGGQLPHWLLPLLPTPTPRGSKRAALLLACALTALGLWPGSRLRFAQSPAAEKRHFPRNPFVRRFFPALALWSFATGAFDPFFNAYFAHGLGVSVGRIGAILAGSQLCQVIGIMAAPWLFRRCGTVVGIFYTQVACAAALFWLAAVSWLGSAAAAYICFAGFQWMSEPGMYSLLMSKVSPHERAGASALNLLVASGSQAIAAAVAGQAFTRFGYAPVMKAVGAAIVVSAVIFRLLLAQFESSPSGTQNSAESQEGGLA